MSATIIKVSAGTTLIDMSISEPLPEGIPGEPHAGAGLNKAGVKQEAEELVEMYAGLSEATFAFLLGMPMAEHVALHDRAAQRRKNRAKLPVADAVGDDNGARALRLRLAARREAGARTFFSLTPVTRAHSMPLTAAKHRKHLATHFRECGASLSSRSSCGPNANADDKLTLLALQVHLQQHEVRLVAVTEANGALKTEVVTDSATGDERQRQSKMAVATALLEDDYLMTQQHADVEVHTCTRSAPRPVIDTAATAEPQQVNQQNKELEDSKDKLRQERQKSQQLKDVNIALNKQLGDKDKMVTKLEAECDSLVLRLAEANPNEDTISAQGRLDLQISELRRRSGSPLSAKKEPPSSAANSLRPSHIGDIDGRITEAIGTLQSQVEELKRQTGSPMKTSTSPMISSAAITLQIHAVSRNLTYACSVTIHDQLDIDMTETAW